MPYRHRDYERIYQAFCDYYKDPKIGEKEYLQWLHDVNLDETREYGYARESYYWTKDNLQFIREDDEAKYYEVELGFPIKSMNGNVYRERDLIAGALTLKGKHPSLNHKHAYWFNEDSPYGAIEIIDGKYHEGACKALVKVPKTTVCPICNGAPMTELIDKRKIVNVSLEGSCVGGSCFDGTCVGFHFTDPPFTFLTTDIPPGIPLTRIKPLENIMVEALHTSTKPKTGEKKMIKKIEAKVLEQSTQEHPMAKNEPQTPEDPMTFHDRVTPERTAIPTQPTTKLGTPAAPDNHHFMGSGYQAALAKPKLNADIRNKAQERGVKEPFADYDDFADCVAKNQDKDDPEAYCAAIKAQAEPSEAYPGYDSLEDCISKNQDKEDPEAYCNSIKTEEPTPQPSTESMEPAYPDRNLRGGDYAPTTGPTEDTSVPKPSNRIGPDDTTDPNMRHLKMPPGAPPSLPSQVQVSTVLGTAPITHGKPKAVTGTAPLESLPSLEERRAKVNAELKAASSEERAIKWQEQYENLYGKYEQLIGAYKQAELHLKQTHEQREEAIRQMHNADIDKQKHIRLYNEEAGNRRKLETRLEEVQTDFNILSRKYNDALDLNLELSKKCTKKDEEYLAMATDLEQIKDKLELARKDAKKIVRIKV